MRDSLHIRISRIFRNVFVRRLLLALVLFGVAIATGVLGFILIEGYTPGEAFYMTIITISTVGYSEVRPLTHNGRLFTSLLIIFNIGVLAYTVSVVSAFIFEGDLKEIIKKNQMEKEIKRLRDHVIVCGYGRLGKIVCKDLEEEGRKVLVVESGEKAIEELTAREKIFIEGNATEDGTILQMKIPEATTIITTFHSDASNIYVVLAAREISKTIKIISRASEEANISKLRLAGADHIIIPEDIGGSYIASLVSGKEAVMIGKWGY